jgi:hypothetical protein
MEKLTPTARLTLHALRTGPGNVHELCERTGRSRSATDKALSELAKATLIVKVDDGGDPADGAPTRWQLADPAPADDQATQPDTGDHHPTQPTAPATPDTGDSAATGAEATDSAPSGESDEPAADAETTRPATPEAADASLEAEPDGQAPQTDGQLVDAAETGDTSPADEGQPDGQPQPDGDGEQPAVAEEPKLCRGCQAQMPKICPCCWQKTPAYCGKCRKDMPQVRRGEPGEPAILSNGLPKLRPGELEAMVETVLREQPVPHHVGVTGWTSGRVAIFLPGRSTGAIGNALRKLTNTGVAELIGDNPERYQLKGATATDADPNTDASQPQAATAAADTTETVTSQADATA